MEFPLKSQRGIVAFLPSAAPQRLPRTSFRAVTCRTRRRRTMTVRSSAATDEIAQVLTKDLGLGRVTAKVRGGSSAWAVTHHFTMDSGARFFIKVSREDIGMFAGEARALRALFRTGTIRVPEVFHVAELKSVKGSYIVMERLELQPVFSMSKLGTALAQLHLTPQVLDEGDKDALGKFGFGVDNTLGETKQPNGWMDDWIEFFKERRLMHQLLLTQDTELIRKGEELCSRLHLLFEGVGEIKPSLLHGDLWSGNVTGCDGDPVIFDPASYYGHHEAEFGMSWCAGFSPTFWEAYHKLIPRAPGFDQRKKLYQLYHFLNHFNLFGGGYFRTAESLLDDLLAHTRQLQAA